MSSTNYQNTFIEIAEDCKVKEGVAPPYRSNTKSVANLEYELISGSPYEYTSDEVKFAVFAIRGEIPKREQKIKREEFFSKGQPCFRASPLTKTYGWGVHSDDLGKIAIYGVETKDYAKYLKDKNITKVKAMRSRKA